MQPDLTTIQIVKSMSQRNLVLHWQSLQATGGLPRFSDFAPGDRAHDPKQIIVWAVEEQDGARSYRNVYGSSYMLEAFGERNTLQSIPSNLLAIFKLGMNASIGNRAITYMLISTTDADGHVIDCERLLLPFSETGQDVTHVLSSIQLVSFTGTIHRRTVVDRFAEEAQVTMFSCIETPEKGRRPVSSGTHPAATGQG